MGDTPKERDLVRQDASVLAQAIKDGEVSAQEVTQAHLDRITAVDDRVHAFLQVTSESALAAARAVDAKRAAGEPLGPLAGGVREGVEHSHGSFAAEGSRPPPRAAGPRRGKRRRFPPPNQ